MNWNKYIDSKPENDDEVVISAITTKGKYSINVKCNCQYDALTNSWIIMDPLYSKCGEDGKLTCKAEDLWCFKSDYKEFIKEQNRLKREAKKKKSK